MKSQQRLKSTEEFLKYVTDHCKRHRYSDDYRSYWIRHPYCAAGLGEDSHVRYAAPPHRIRSRGAGGRDTDDNLISLCTDCRAQIRQIGVRTFARMHPSVAGKLRRALRRTRPQGKGAENEKRVFAASGLLTILNIQNHQKSHRTKLSDFFRRIVPRRREGWEEDHEEHGRTGPVLALWRATGGALHQRHIALQSLHR